LDYEARKEDWWFRLGIYYGTLLNLMFYTPEDYLEFDPIQNIDYNHAESL